MKKTNDFFAIVLSLSLGVSLQGVNCGSKNSHGPGSNLNLPKLKLPSAPPTAQELNEFLNQRIDSAGTNPEHFNLNTTRTWGHTLAPRSPFFHSYRQADYAETLLSAELPLPFAYHLPEPLKIVLLNQISSELKIYFTVQAFINLPLPEPDNNGFPTINPSTALMDPATPLRPLSLKPATWLFPEVSDYRRVVGSPSHLSETVQMQLFDPPSYMSLNVSQRNGVTTQEMRDFRVILHDGLISPDTGHIHLGPQDPSVAFYSLVQSPHQRRTVVTLHWILRNNPLRDPQQPATLFREVMLQLAQNHPDIFNLRHLLTALHQPDNLFSQTTHADELIQKLTQLITGSPQFQQN